MRTTVMRWLAVVLGAASAAGCGAGAGADDGASEIGNITATVGGADLVFSVAGPDGDGRSGFEVRSAGGVETVTISSNRLKEGDVDGVEPGSLSLMSQLGIYGMKNVTLTDGQGFMNPLESTGMSGTEIEFTSRGEGGVWAGTFSATLERQNPEGVDAGKASTLQAPVTIDGFFSIEP